MISLNILRLLPAFMLMSLLSTPNAAPGQTISVPDLSGLWMPDRERSELWPSEPPFTEAGRRAYEAADPRDDPSLRCIFNVPNILSGIGPYLLEVIQLTDRAVSLYEQMHQVRRIYLDGRPPAENATIVGHSTGHYDGDMLVVETTDIRPLKNAGPPLQVLQSHSLRVIEEYSRMGELLEAEITIDDPVFYTRPWTVRKVWRAMPDAEIYEYVCEDPRYNSPVPEQSE